MNNKEESASQSLQDSDRGIRNGGGLAGRSQQNLNMEDMSAGNIAKAQEQAQHNREELLGEQEGGTAKQKAGTSKQKDENKG